MSAQLLGAEQRCHCRVNVGAGEPVQVPSDSVNVLPCTGEPLTVGGEVFCGALVGGGEEGVRVAYIDHDQLPAVEVPNGSLMPSAKASEFQRSAPVTELP